MNVHVNRGVQFVCNDPDFFQVFVAYGVGRMGAESNFDSRVKLEVGEHFDGLAQGFICVAGAGNRKIENRNGDLRANAAVVHALTGDFRVEIHVAEAGNAALDLLGDCQTCRRGCQRSARG